MASNKPTPERRMGPAGSDNWHAMLDGAEVVLREEGHVALTSRRIAEQIGVKQRLVYYYFATMDELVIALFHRLSERELLRLQQAQAAELPLRQLWDICLHTADGRLISEYMALAARIDGLRQKVVHFIEESRRIQIAALDVALSRIPRVTGMSSPALALLSVSAALTINRERQLGIELGHQQTLDVIEGFLLAAEPA